MTRRLLVTGGAGFIGSHTVLALLNDGYEVTVVDNLCNSSAESLKRVEKLAGKSVDFRKLDLVTDAVALDKLFDEQKFLGVIHFASLKAVGDSVRDPISYYSNNLTGALHLFACMRKHKVFNIIFSSSATVYGEADVLPVTEESPLKPALNPYGRTKVFIEDILRDLFISDPAWNIVILRYFNPIGAHESGLIGEDPLSTPNNLMPYITQVAVGKLKQLTIHGSDYPTIDGTGVRDYIHVVDLANGHVAALRKIESSAPAVRTYNLGQGVGFSVLQMVEALKKASGREIPYTIGARRVGDIASLYCDASLAERELGWKATRDITKCCEDSWRWQSQNPNGFLPAAEAASL